LTVEQHEAYRRLILGGSRATAGRLQAWAKALRETLQGSERIEADTYTWITNRTRTYRSLRSGAEAGTMSFDDAAKIYRAGLRACDPSLPSAYDWQMAVSEHVPEVAYYSYGSDPKNPTFLFALILPEMVPLIADDIAAVAVKKDRNGSRRAKGEEIERYLYENIGPRDRYKSSWNSKAVWAVEQIVFAVMFERYYRGQFGPHSSHLDSAVNEVAPQVALELRRMLSDGEPRAYERLQEQLQKRVERARLAAELKRSGK
jgi:hypothetical protein